MRHEIARTEPCSIDCQIADTLGNTRARLIDQGYECVDGILSGGRGKEARRVRATREGGDLALNPGQVIHLHLEFRLRAYV